MVMSDAERQRAYRERQKIRMAQDPEYAAEVRAKRREQGLRRFADPEQKAKKLATTRKWHAQKVKEDPEYADRKRESTRRWQKENPQKVSESYRKWYEKNNRSEYNLNWSRANMDKRCESARRRRALLKGAATIDKFTKAEIFERDNGICYLCQQLVNPDPKKWHLEHIIPLSKGGEHTRNNVAVSCPPCNLRKTNKLLTLGGESHIN